MKKLSLILLVPFLVACGGSNSGGGGGGKSQSASASATANLAPGSNCPVLNGKFVRSTDGGEQAVYIYTQTGGGSYSYSFENPKTSGALFQQADNAFHQNPGDPDGNDRYEVTCDAVSVRKITQQDGGSTITITYTAVGANQVRVDASSPAEFLKGTYDRDPRAAF